MGKMSYSEFKKTLKQKGKTEKKKREKKQTAQAKVDVDHLIDDLDDLERSNMKPVNSINNAVREIVIDAPVVGANVDSLMEGTKVSEAFRTQKDIKASEQLRQDTGAAENTLAPLSEFHYKAPVETKP